MNQGHGPTCTDEASIPTENEANNRRMSGTMRRKVATRTMPPMPVAGNLAPPTPLPPPRDEDLPAAKRARIQTSTSISTVADGDVDDADVDANSQSITDSDTALSINNYVVIARTDVVTEEATIPIAKSSRAPRRCWKPEEDAELIAAIKKHGNADWVAVAVGVPGRRNIQCRQRWLTNLDHISDRPAGKRWTAEEDAELIAAVKKHGDANWVAAAAGVSGRTNNQCRERWLNNLDPTSDRASGKWTVKEDAELIAAVKKIGNTDWAAVAASMSGRTNRQCRKRWLSNLDPTSDRVTGKWTAAEDAELLEAEKRHGNNWVAVAADMSGRTNVQCCQRWVYVLDPAREPKTGKHWTAEEDAELIEAEKRHGNNWVAVAADMTGRTNRQCCRRWVYVLDPKKSVG
jgi:hypothetical protein